MIEVLLSLVFVFATILVAGLFALEFTRAKRTLNIFKIIVVYTMLFNLLGFPILIWGLDAYRAEYVNDLSILFILLSLIIASSVCFLSGYRVVNYKSLNLERYIVFKHKMEESGHSVLISALFFIVIGVASLLMYITYFGFDALPIVLSLTSDDSAVAVSRSTTGADFTLYSWYQLGMNDFLMLGVGFYIVWFSFSARLKFIRSIVLLSLIVLLLFSFGVNGEKGKFIDVILFLFVLTSFIGLISINFVSIFAALFICLAILIPGYWFMMGDASLTKSLYGIFSRTLTGQLHAGYHHVEFYQQMPNLYFGSTYPNPNGLLPFEPVEYTKDLMQWVHGTQYVNSTKVTGSMPTHFWGELLFNFGVIGVCVFSFTIGMWIKFIDDCFKGPKIHKSTHVLYTWMIVHYKDLAYTGASNFAFDKKMLIILLAFILLSFLTVVFRKTGQDEFIAL